jgi:hypothetical protein
MSLDLHALEPNGQPGALLYQIDDALYVVLTPLWQAYQAKTDYLIDPYDDLILWGGPVQLLGIARNVLSNTQGSQLHVALSRLIELLAPLARDSTPIGFFGD